MRDVRPKIKIELNFTDRLIIALGATAVLAMVAIPAMSYANLPDTIAIHFSGKGEADGWGSKSALLILPCVGILLWASMLWLSTKPHIFNYPTTITAENAESQYRLGVRLILLMAFISTATFAFLEYMMVKSADGNFSGLGTYTILIWTLVTLGVPVIYLVLSSRMK